MHRTRLLTWLLIGALPLYVACSRSGEEEIAASDRGLQFRSDWVTANSSNWERELAHLVGEPNLNYLEIGVFEGRSLIWMLDNVLTHPSCRATGIDMFHLKKFEKTFRSNLKKAGHEKRVTTLVGKSEEMLRGLERESFDLIYIDGSHMATHVFMDAAMTWPLLKTGGILMFDDYAWKGPGLITRSMPDELLPRSSINAFLTANRNSLKLLLRGWQVYVQKTENPCGLWPSSRDCSPFGGHLYHWIKQRLINRESGKEITLTPEETLTLEAFLKSRSFGEVDYDLEQVMVADPAFRALAERLELGV